MIRKKRNILLFVLIILLLAVWLLRSPILQAMAAGLMIQDNPQPSDVIIVLGGEPKGERTKQAVKLYKAGLANRLLFSDGTDLSWRTRAVDEMTALAGQLGVPEQTIVTEPRSRSTYENAVYTKAIMKTHGWRSAIVVTTDWHTRRSRFIFNKVYGESGISLTFASAKDHQAGYYAYWWRDSEKQQVILTEWAKLVVYWLRYGL